LGRSAKNGVRKIKKRTFFRSAPQLTERLEEATFIRVLRQNSVPVCFLFFWGVARKKKDMIQINTVRKTE